MSDGKQRYRNILNAVFGSTWAIMPSKLEAIVDFLAVQSEGVKFTAEEIDQRLAVERGKRLAKVSGKVAVLPLYGVIGQKANMMTEFSGGTSTEIFGKAFDDAMSNSEIKAIVFDVDSPGGTVYGVPELADKILKARGTKQIIAVANSLSASAAYWISAAADQIVATPSGEVGSVGVYSMHVDWSGYNEREGVKPTYISAGKYKTEFHPDAPLNEEAISELQRSVNETYDMFIDALAKSRGTTANRVRGNYGEGRVFSAKRAVEAGLADRIGTLERVLEELGAGRATSSGKRTDGDGMDPVMIADPAEDTGEDADMLRRRWANQKRKAGA
jgi:signal peptide peptidase SppA